MSMRGNVSLYTPLITRRQARVAALPSLVDKALDGAFGSLVQHLVTDQKLSKKDKSELTRIIRELDKGGRDTK
jgi:predicted transcriptional regulator